MSIRIKFFASLREKTGFSEKFIAAEGLATVKDVVERLDLASLLGGTVLYAVNMEYASLETPVTDGDEVAFFPPVTGGSS
ncbi:MAG: molybdopterin converting factor subunit 1 [Gammaproteobacteria bacterium]